jgi:hypothetical protein
MNITPRDLIVPQTKELSKAQLAEAIFNAPLTPRGSGDKKGFFYDMLFRAPFRDNSSENSELIRRTHAANELLRMRDHRISYDENKSFIYTIKLICSEEKEELKEIITDSREKCYKDRLKDIIAIEKLTEQLAKKLGIRKTHER